MKVLWISNYPLPSICKHLGLKQQYNEGWKCTLSEQLSHEEEIEDFVVAFPTENANFATSGLVDGVKYFAFYSPKRKSRCEEIVVEQLRKIYLECQPDVIHIWGTEFPHSLAALKAASVMGIIDRVCVSIQGVMMACAEMYDKCLPRRVYRKKIGDILLRRGVKREKKMFAARAVCEQEALRLCKNVIGRTDFDKAYTTMVNPSVNYYYCAETMRENFYSGQWDSDAHKKFTLFMSQATYPIKGLHIVLKILALLKERYCDVQLRIAGGDILSPATGRLSFLKKYAYSSYLQSLVKKYALQDNIVMLGSLDAENMKAEFLNCHCHISGSMIENSSNSVCEAMLLGVPTVASNVGGMSDIITHQRDGYLYQFDDPIMGAFYVQKIFDNREEAASVGACAKAKAERVHNPQKNYEALMDIYQKVKAAGEQER